MQFLLSALSSYLPTRRLSEPRQNTTFRDFPNISRNCIFFLQAFAQLYFLSSDSISLLYFSSSDSTSLLCFSTLHIIGSFTSKFPVLIIYFCDKYKNRKIIFIIIYPSLYVFSILLSQKILIQKNEIISKNIFF